MNNTAENTPLLDGKPQYNLRRFGWMLFDDINRRLSILIEECRHLQQVVHFHGDFEIKPDNENSAATQPQKQREMEQFKHYLPKEFTEYPPITRSMLTLYDQLGGLILGLLDHQKDIRERFEQFLLLDKTDVAHSQVQKQEHHSESKQEAWFWFIALRGHLLHKVIENYMEHLEHAHEKLIQILETKPDALPQPILLRRWNSGLHGRFLSEYSRHLDWEIDTIINELKDNKLSTAELDANRRRHSFIHSWAHTPTSMVDTFKVRDKDRNDNSVEREYKMGNIRSAFFYLEMPQLYPLLYHECAHLHFDWDNETNSDPSRFFTSRKQAAKSLEESSAQFNWNLTDFWNRYTEEIWADTIAINLGGLPYLTALTMQIMGQSAGQFFYAKSTELPLQDWTKNPIFDLELPNQDRYLWQARLELAIQLLKQTHAAECNIGLNRQWLSAITLGIQQYQAGGLIAFNAKRISKQHENWWRYRNDINTWVTKTIHPYQIENLKQLKELTSFSVKYQISEHLLDSVIFPIVSKYEGIFFKEEADQPDKCKTLKEYFLTEQKDLLRIEYLPFSIKWHFSKFIIKELEHKNQDDFDSFTVAYANYIRNDGGAAFRIALEWIMARNDLNIFFADFLDDEKRFNRPDYINKLTKISQKNHELNRINELFAKFDKFDKQRLISNLRRQTTYNEREIQISTFQKIAQAVHNELNSKQRNYIEIENLIKNFIAQFLENHVDTQLAKTHVNKKQESASIGTMTFGAIAKFPIPNSDGTAEKKSPYYNKALKVHQYYEKVIEGINNKVRKLTNYHADSPFTYSVLTDADTSSPAKSALYFLTGDYDFVFRQDGITAAESSFHPINRPAILTKPRTVLDLYIQEESKPDREKWGRISLIKFKYRWEMYILCHQLSSEANNLRSRLMLSSAWEDGILITWHRGADDFLKHIVSCSGHTFDQPAKEEKPYAPTTSNTMDAQSSLFLFKFKKINDAYQPVTCDNKTDIKDIENLSKDMPDPVVTKIEMAQLITKLTVPDEKGNIIFKDANWVIGRYDFVVTWNAKDPDELARAMFKLPESFWSNVFHINTTITANLNYSDSPPTEKRVYAEKGADAEKEYYCFKSEITNNIFHNKR